MVWEINMREVHSPIQVFDMLRQTLARVKAGVSFLPSGQKWHAQHAK